MIVLIMTYDNTLENVIMILASLSAISCYILYMKITSKYYRYPLTFYNLYFHVLLIIYGLIFSSDVTFAWHIIMYPLIYATVAVPLYIFNVYLNPWYSGKNIVEINHFAELFLALLLLGFVHFFY